jgi:hypothetical protein
MANTSLIGLTLPVTGTQSGQWGDTVNNAISQIIDVAVAGTQTISADADITLTLTTGTYASTGLTANSSQYAVLLWTAAGTVTRTITVPAQSKTYVVINKSSTQSIIVIGTTGTGVTVVAGTRAIVAWDGTNFVNVGGGSAAGSNTQVQFNSSGAFGASSALTWDGTTLAATKFSGALNGTVGATTASTGAFTTITTTSAIAYNYGGTGQSSLFNQWGVTYASTTGVLATTAAGTTGQVLTATTGSAPTWATPSATGATRGQAVASALVFGL